MDQNHLCCHYTIGQFYYLSCLLKDSNPHSEIRSFMCCPLHQEDNCTGTKIRTRNKGFGDLHDTISPYPWKWKWRDSNPQCQRRLIYSQLSSQLLNTSNGGQGENRTHSESFADFPAATTNLTIALLENYDISTP
jgi:hypothetical protein